MKVESRKCRYGKRIQAKTLFFVFLVGVFFIGSTQYAFATEKMEQKNAGEKQIVCVGGIGSEIAMRERGKDIVIVPDNPNTSAPEGYVTVSFNKGSYGDFGAGDKFVFFILKGKTIADAKAANPALMIPTVLPKSRYLHRSWECGKEYKKDLSDHTTGIKANIQFQAQYEEKPVVVENNPNDADYVKVIFKALEGGNFFEKTSNVQFTKVKEFYVLRGTTRNLLYLNIKDRLIPTPDKGYVFNVWDPAIVNETNPIQGGEVLARFKKAVIGPVDPTDTPNPDNTKYWIVNYVGGEHGTTAKDNAFYVLKTANKILADLSEPEITPENEWKFTGWDRTYTTAINQNLTVTARYKQKVVTEDPGDEAYAKVDFFTEKDGTFENSSTTTFWVFKDESINLTVPTAKGKTGWTFIDWDPAMRTSYSEDTIHKARYVQKPVITEENSNDVDYIRVIFHANGGRIGSVETKDIWALKGIAKFSDAKEKVTDPIKTGSIFKEWKDALTNGTKVSEDKVFDTEGEIFYAVYTKNTGFGSVISSPSILNMPKFFTPKDKVPIRLEDEKQGKLYIAEGTKESLNGAVKLDITVDEQGKIHINFLDKDGNSVKTKGAVKIIMPIKEGLKAPYRVKVNGVYTTYGEENGYYSIILRPTSDVEMIRFTDTVDKQEGILEGTKEALNGAVSIKLEKKQSSVFVFHLYDAAGKEISSNDYVFVEVPIPEGKKAPYRLSVDGVSTTFEETDHGTISFAVFIK